MKILLICSVRCGGTYLAESLSENYNLKLMIEPTHLKTDIDNLLVKLIVWKHGVQDILDYSKKFDYIVILDRLNIEEQTQSFMTVMEKTLQPYDVWKWDEKTKDLGKGYQYYYDFLIDVKDTLKKISYKIDRNIFYYEDVYFENQPIYDLQFNPEISKRLRKTSLKKTNI
jgi:hypothetical protein